jgi:hypothetical protein
MIFTPDFLRPGHVHCFGGLRYCFKDSLFCPFSSFGGRLAPVGSRVSVASPKSMGEHTEPCEHAACGCPGWNGIFGHFDVLHEVKDRHGIVCSRIESHSIHLAVPFRRSREQQDVLELVVGEWLMHLERWEEW